jgi:lipopolysaccharide biosynthesis regulator YciM
MEFDYWWLLGLLPLFFGFGWMAARIDIRQLVHESRALPRSYFKGLNFLLNEQPDKAIESFIEVVKVDPETVELHFALGSLFRRRGEYDRAIRMHQNLVERPDLGADQKLAALFELAQDYLKAGILDRAEALFARLEDGPHATEARRHLLDIFQQEKDWPRAIEMARRLQRDSGESRGKEISQFLCELGATEATHSRPEGARRHLEGALEANRKSVRASVALGDLARAAGDLEAAIEHWKRLESQDPAYLALVAQRLLEAYRAVGRLEEGLTLLAGYLERYPSLDLLDTVFQTTMEARGAEAAYKLVRDELRRNPTLLGLDRLLEAQIVADAHPERRRDLELVRNLVHSHTRRLARYRCEECGFKARQFYWHCPACGGWESYPPRRTEEFELSP